MAEATDALTRLRKSGQLQLHHGRGYTNMKRPACICNLKVTCRWCYKPENINGKINSLFSVGCNYVTSKDGLSEAMMHFPYCASSTVQVSKA